MWIGKTLQLDQPRVQTKENKSKWWGKTTSGRNKKEISYRPMACYKNL